MLLSLVPRLSRAARTKNSLVTIVDFLGPTEQEFVLANQIARKTILVRETLE